MAIFILFLAHYVGDFLFQTRMMGENKGKKISWLLKHVFVYATVVGLLSFPLFPNWEIFLLWITINFFIHLMTDAMTSRIAAFFNKKKNTSGFWRVIGLDQMSHYLVLYYSFILLTQ